jgi:dihydrofolate reductase
MTALIYYVAASLDGYIATLDGGVDWLHGFGAGGEDYGYHAFYASVDAAWQGRQTYEKCLDFGEWPYAGKPSVVFTRAALTSERSDVRFTHASPEAELVRAAADGHRRIWLVGGGALAAACRQAGIVTEYIVSMMPVVLGAGIPLFAPGGRFEALQLVDTRSWPDGVVQLRYRPHSPPSEGDTA